MTRYDRIILRESTRGTVTVRARDVPLGSYYTVKVFRAGVAALESAWAWALERCEVVTHRKSAVDSSINPFTGRLKTRHYMPKGTRDSQKSKVYAAGRTAFPDEQKMVWRTTAQCQAVLDRWTNAMWFVRRWGTRYITVEDNGGRSGSCASHDTIFLSTYHRNPYILAHELAHCLASEHGHGALYARTYLDLVRYAIGKDAYTTLKAAMRAHRVKVAPRRTQLDGHGVARVHPRAGKAKGNPAALAAYRARKLSGATTTQIIVDEVTPFVVGEAAEHLFAVRAERTT